jgi:LAO/AO transport system kinase
MPDRSSVAALVEGVVSRNRRALGKAITLVESSRPDHQDQAQRLLEELLPRTGNAVRMGITGVPGVGKSTFIESFGLYLAEQSHRIAVLAVDPSSSLSGGSILCDKTRMPRLSAHDASFIRPSPASGFLGGVARHTREAMLLCEAAGYDVILVETVGVGQSEYTVASMVDFFLVLMLPGAGDELQGIKRGILELADAMAINKADGDNIVAAERAKAEYTAAFRLMRPPGGWLPPVLTVSALTSIGMEAVWNVVLEHRKRLTDSGELTHKRTDQQRKWLWDMIEEGLKARFVARDDVQRELAHAEEAACDGRITPTEAARRVLSLLK